MSSNPTTSRNAPTTWRSFILSLYPDALRRTHSVPPEHFNRVPYDRDTVPGTGLSALVLPVPNVPPVSQPSGSAAPVQNVPSVSQPSGSATPVQNVPPVSQPSGSATPVQSIPSVSQPSGSATPVQSVPSVSQPSGGATPVQNVPPISQLVNPPTQYRLWPEESQRPASPVRVQESDFRDDAAQRHVLANLRALGDAGQEPMFIVSQLNFGDYLNEPSYAAAVQASQLPRPSDLDKKYAAGDFDILLFHRRHGLLLGELKSVGINHAILNLSPAQADSEVAKKVGQAVKQLDKSETVVSHLLSDLAPSLTVRKTLFLPYVSRAHLHRVLTANPPLEQEVCRSLGAGNTADAVQLCCCSDQLSDPATYWHVTPAVLSQLTSWWQHRVTCTTDASLTDDLYLDIVARFVGPATTVRVHCSTDPRRSVEVRTAGEAVAELGRALACLVLTSQQCDIMQRSPRLVMLTGPPGTGKTILMVLQGLRWARQGRDVDVVSIDPDTLAASLMIQHQLQVTLSADSTTSPTPGTVRLRQYDFRRHKSDVDRAVKDLLSVVQGDTLCVLVDEASDVYSHRARGLRRLVSGLTGRVTQLYLWCAGIYHRDVPPALQEEVLTTPLRSAPCIIRTVQPGLDVRSHEIRGYSDSGLPAPGDGPSVIELEHRGDGHRGRDPVNCDQCGRDAAAKLRSIGVGAGGGGHTNALQYRDVMVITEDGTGLHDDVTDDAGRVTSPASGFVRALRDAGVPVCVLEGSGRVGGSNRVGGSGNDRASDSGSNSDSDSDRVVDRDGWERRVADVALSRTDRVTVSACWCVQGLERRVVVWLSDWRWRRVKALDIYYALPAMSRCTTQLIIVNTPDPDDTDTDSSDSTHLTHTHTLHSTDDEDETTEDI